MTGSSPFYRLVLVARDAILGLAAFFAVIAALSPEGGPPSMAAGFAAPQGQAISLVILAGVFSSLVAFNLAILRHLRRVYASPRRGAWRRG